MTSGSSTIASYAKPADALTAMASIAAAAETDLAPAGSIHYGGESLSVMPFLFCAPLTALLSWWDALDHGERDTDLTARSMGDMGSELAFTATLSDVPVDFYVITHLELGKGPRTVEEIRALAADEGAPDLSLPLTIEQIGTPKPVGISTGNQTPSTA